MPDTIAEFSEKDAGRIADVVRRVEQMPIQPLRRGSAGGGIGGGGGGGGGPHCVVVDHGTPNSNRIYSHKARPLLYLPDEEEPADHTTVPVYNAGDGASEYEFSAINRLPPDTQPTANDLWLITDANEEPVRKPVLLDGSGKALAAGASPFYHEFNFHDWRPFLTLNLV